MSHFLIFSLLMYLFPLPAIPFPSITQILLSNRAAEDDYPAALAVIGHAMMIAFGRPGFSNFRPLLTIPLPGITFSSLHPACQSHRTAQTCS